MGNALINFLLIFLKVVGVCLFMFLMIFGFHKVPARWLLKKFGNDQEMERLQRLLAINRAYSVVAAIRENVLDRIFNRPLFVNPVEHFESPPSGMNRSQFIENQYYDLKKELRKMGVSDWKIQAFL